MAGTSISELIFFMAAILISTTVALTFIEVAENYSSGLRDEASIVETEMRSRITLINDPAMVPYDTSTSNLTFYIKNTGTGDLSVEDIVVSTNGTTASGRSMKTTILDGGSRWSPGDVVEVEFTVKGLKEGVDYNGWASTSGLTDHGVPRGSAQDTISFRIRGD